MILAANQPLFAPYAGFFEKAARADVFVLLDAVQFPRGTTWVSRNRFKHAQGALWLTVPVWKKGLGLQKIGDVRVCHESDWATKHILSLCHAYKNAPFVNDHLPVLDEAFARRFDRLADLNIFLIRHVLDYLRCDTRLVLFSELDIRASGSLLLVEVCRRVGAAAYLAQDAAKKYLAEDVFEDGGVEVRYFNPKRPVYPQLWGNFIGNLSVFDLLFNCGPKARDFILGREPLPPACR